MLAFQFQVMMEARHKLVVIDCELFEAVVQVEHVAILTALQKRAQLGTEQFFGREGSNFSLCLIPIVVHRKRIRFEAAQADVFASIDLHLKFQRCLRKRQTGRRRKR
jgi:hypothetical protein